MKRLLVALACLTVFTPAPAHAVLGETFLRFKNSQLLHGETMFRFEGRVGARYRFGPALRSTVGTSMFMLDTQDGIIVQQTIVLHFPRNKRDVKRVEALADLFLADAGLKPKEREEALMTFRTAYEMGKSYETAKNPELKPLSFEDRLNLNVFTSLSLGHILLAIGLKPDAQATPVPS